MIKRFERCAWAGDELSMGGCWFKSKVQYSFGEGTRTRDLLQRAAACSELPEKSCLHCQVSRYHKTSLPPHTIVDQGKSQKQLKFEVRENKLHLRISGRSTWPVIILGNGHLFWGKKNLSQHFIRRKGGFMTKKAMLYDQ